jgi:hypothetical protein
MSCILSSVFVCHEVLLVSSFSVISRAVSSGMEVNKETTSKEIIPTNTNYYRQISGTPMGSPLSSFLAEAVMQDLESKAVINNDDIKTWDMECRRCIHATVKKDKTDDILLTINNSTKNIKFTKEEEHDNKLTFLDVLITKTDNGTLTTQVYCKKTHTDQILNYNSNHPTQHKVSCIKT